MTRTRRIRRTLFALALSSLLALAAACGGDSDTTSVTTLRASSGSISVELTVPEGALPDGMTADQITIEVVAAVASGSTDPGRAELIEITLGPGGTTFKQPLTLAIDLGADDRSVLALLISGETPIDDVQAPAYDLDAEGDAETSSLVVVVLSHFSAVQLTSNSDRIAPQVLAEPPDRPILVGEAFTVEAAVLVPDIETEETFDHPSIWRAPITTRTRTAEDEPWKLRYRWRATATNGTVLRPVAASAGYGRDPRLALEAREPAIFTQRFECIAVGSFVLRLDGMAMIPVIALTIYSADQYGPSSFTRVSAVSSIRLAPVALFGQCVPAPETPTPSPTPDQQDDAESASDDDEFETVGVDVLVVGGQRFPIEQFDYATRDACERDHYHSSLPAYSLEGGTTFDADPGGCGFGTIDGVIFVEVPLEMWTVYRELLSGGP